MKTTTLASRTYQLITNIRAQIVLALLISPGALLAVEGIQTNPKRWLLIFPAGVVMLVIILLRKTRHK